MWDYGNHKEMPAELMQLQLDTYYKWLKEGKIEGVIYCSNFFVYKQKAAYDMARAWIREHGDEEI
ncbi:MAG: hypothetical protein E7408_07550 [Ruminococcaceae bacterium]|nr:hypothetical protein [Oscillospiraceae bacterium]